MKATEALETILSSLEDQDIALFTTGFISRRACQVKDRGRNFYMLGSMGLLSAFGLGVALNKPTAKVIVFEGDGSILMSLGNLPLIGHLKPKNLFHIVLDNESYESTGGQPSITKDIDLAELALSASYKAVKKVKDLEALRATLKSFLEEEGPCFLLVKVEPSEMVSPRVSMSPLEIKQRLRSLVV